MEIDVEELIEILTKLKERKLTGPLIREEFTEYLKSRGLAPLTIIRNLKCFNIFVRYAARVEDISPQVIDAFLKRAKSVKTYNNHVTFLHHLAKFLNMPSLKQIPYLKPPIKPVIIPDVDELRRFRRNLQRKPKLVFDFLLSTGLRIWESCMLTPDRIEPFGEGLYLVDARSIHRGRTKLSFFSFTLKEVAEKCLAYASKRGYSHLFMNHNPSIKTDVIYACTTADYFRKKFYHAYRSTGIKITPHTLRKVFTSNMLKSGMPPIFLAILQGRSLGFNTEIKSYIDIRLLASYYKQNISWIYSILEE